MCSCISLFDLLLLATVLLSVCIVYKWRLFALPKTGWMQLPSSRVSFMTTLIAYSLYLSMHLLVPTCMDAVFKVASIYFSVSPSPSAQIACTQIAVIATACLVLVFLSHLYEKEKKVIWGSVSSRLRMLLKGMGIGLVVYPMIIGVIQAVYWLISCYVAFAQTEQVAVMQLKQAAATPILFSILLVQVVVMVPVVEELLFRGYIQNFFMGICGAKSAVILSSLLFAAFHYSAQQHLSNIQLLVGLFVLSSLIGTVYIRERSLFVSIGIHAGFNLISIFFMVFSNSF